MERSNIITGPGKYLFARFGKPDTSVTLFYDGFGRLCFAHPDEPTVIAVENGGDGSIPHIGQLYPRQPAITSEFPPPRNVIINGEFAANQRGYASAAEAVKDAAEATPPPPEKPKPIRPLFGDPDEFEHFRKVFTGNWNFGNFA